MSRRKLSVSIFFFNMLLSVLSYAQGVNPLAPEELLRRLEDPDWQYRSEAFYDCLKLGGQGLDPPGALSKLLEKWPEKSDEIKLTLIRLLEIENEVTRDRVNFILEEYRKKGPDMPHPFPDAEERTEYYANLIWAVTSLSDPRSLNALLGAIKTGNMVTSTLAAFGTIALDPVIGKLQDKEERLAATVVLVQMLEPKNVQKVSDPVSREKIKKVLMNATSDESDSVRRMAIEGLAKLGDTDIIPLIENAAKNDPYDQSEFIRALGGKPDKENHYPVRERANELLKKWKRN